jgi:formylglycine-generating enzyme required for sulfatase activity
VWEWTRSLWGKYPYPTGQKARARREDLQASQDKTREQRGGTFFDPHGDVRCACRLRGDPNDWGRNAGFRVVVRPCL